MNYEQSQIDAYRSQNLNERDIAAKTVVHNYLSLGEKYDVKGALGYKSVFKHILLLL